MYIKKLYVKNYRILKDTLIEFSDKVNIFVGENDSGKSTILEALSIITSGRLNGYTFERQIKANLFNDDVRKKYIDSLGVKPIEPPKIIIEAYFDECDARYGGTNNELGENVAGIRVEVSLKKELSNIYTQLLDGDEIYDIPVELYSVNYNYFSGETVSYRFSPVKAAVIDTTRKDYSYVVDKFVSDNISSVLTPQEQTNLSTAYRKSKHDFGTNSAVSQLNAALLKNKKVKSDRTVTIGLKEEDVEAWKSQMSMIVDDIPFENTGFGTQNTIKMEMALKNAPEQINIVLIEEPENNLSFTNMSKLINKIITADGKQTFISTHSSYVANKLALKNLFLVHSGRIKSFNELCNETISYFQKLPGYDTLRLVLAEKVILVEGPTDELIIQRAYRDKKGKLPIDDGIDIIVVDSLAFKRYCDIAVLLNKRVVIVTDNDRNINSNINDKYKDYFQYDNLVFVYEQNEALNTIEPSIVAVNFDTEEHEANFRTVISKGDSMMKNSRDEILDFMTKNKVEWAFRVFDSNLNIIYPEYIQNAIEKFD